MRTTAEIREGFLRYFEEKGHTRLPSAPLPPPPEDTSTLLVSAGMQPLKPYFLGQKQPPSTLMTTYQKCFRTTDIDDVGLDGYHLSFFEMMGNFSVGEYFKEGAVEHAWEFMRDRLELDFDKLWVSVFAGDPNLGLGEDEVAIRAWEAVGQPRERVVGLPRTENFWQAGETGPCGPCSEMYFDRGPELSCGRPDCGPGCPCERFLEFWNLVFMEFDLGSDGELTPLPKPVIDTGLGLDRTAAIQQGVISVYETDGFQALMDWIEAESGVAWTSSEKAMKAHRIMADHGRGMTFLVADGVLPSNEGRGYVLRRVIRRAVQQARGIGLSDFWRVSGLIVDQMGQWYPELGEHRDRIAEALRAEEERFSLTLERGMGLFEEVAAGGAISGEDAFRLHDTYGFPLELTRELARERGLAVDEEEFTRLMAEQRERSRAAAAFEGEIKVSGPPTEFVGFETTDVLTAILALEELGDGTFQAKLERSPFYPEGGGQVSDQGWIENEETGARADLVRATRVGEDQVLTFRGEGFAAGDRVRASVPWSVRFPTMANHTATHLLHKALRETLGEHVVQAGSAVRPDKLRFDFRHDKALTAEEREEIERIVNEKVFQNLPVRTFVTPIDEARNLGATMLFGEKYGDEVRVVEVDGYSRELCGGTHVRSTAEIGPFVILSESSVGSGARRIEALTAGEAWEYLRARSEELDEVRAELEKARKEAKAPKAKESSEVTIRDDANGIVVAEVKAVKGSALKDLSDQLRQSRKADAVLLGSVDDGRAYLVVNLDQSLVDKGLDAVAVARKAAEKIGGGGGGRPTLAEAGGRDPGGLAEAYEVAKSEISAA
ncbi:MAG TPA: alanine--tRNA ligase [Gaiellaceae bacterium]|nr:alanine--tRNA ligase [Gaiellaceae bacterium]